MDPPGWPQTACEGWVCCGHGRGAGERRQRELGRGSSGEACDRDGWDIAGMCWGGTVPSPASPLRCASAEPVKPGRPLLPSGPESNAGSAHGCESLHCVVLGTWGDIRRFVKLLKHHTKRRNKAKVWDPSEMLIYWKQTSLPEQQPCSRMNCHIVAEEGHFQSGSSPAARIYRSTLSSPDKDPHPKCAKTDGQNVKSLVNINRYGWFQCFSCWFKEIVCGILTLLNPEGQWISL